MSLLEIRNLHVRADDKEILKGVDLAVGKGEIPSAGCSGSVHRRDVKVCDIPNIGDAEALPGSLRHGPAEHRGEHLRVGACHRDPVGPVQAACARNRWRSRTGTSLSAGVQQTRESRVRCEVAT